MKPEKVFVDGGQNRPTSGPWSKTPSGERRREERGRMRRLCHLRQSGTKRNMRCGDQRGNRSSVVPIDGSEQHSEWLVRVVGLRFFIMGEVGVGAPWMLMITGEASPRWGRRSHRTGGGMREIPAVCLTDARSGALWTFPWILNAVGSKQDLLRWILA